MKVAVSIPDLLFAEADALARRTKQSRSRLYARALSAYVAAQPEEDLTQAINAIVDEKNPQDEEDRIFVRAAARNILKHTEW